MSTKRRVQTVLGITGPLCTHLRTRACGRAPPDPAAHACDLSRETDDGRARGRVRDGCASTARAAAAALGAREDGEDGETAHASSDMSLGTA